MKTISTIIFMLFGVLGMDAQTTVKGLLKDSISQEGEPYATIRIYTQKSVNQKDAKPVAMTLTDNDGAFKAVVNGQGEFTIICSSVGKTAAIRNFTIKDEKTIDLGTLLLSDKESVMKSVEIVAQKPIVKMEADKMTYSVEDDVDSKSMTVLDMLRKVPMVTVDGQDNISVNGQSSFKVYLNGKPNMMLSSNPSQVFKAMPASMVSSIEVVTSPGAKYDAEGAGGILNIKMAGMGGGGGSSAPVNGYNGSISATGGNRGGGASANISGQQNKFSYNANVSYNKMNNGSVDVDMERIEKDGTTTTYHAPAKNKVPFVMGNVGLGYEIDSLSQVNASFGIRRFQVTNTGNPTTSLFGGIHATPFSYGGRTKEIMNNTGYNASLDYQRFFDTNHESSLTATYQFNHNPGFSEHEDAFFVTGLSPIDLTNRYSYDDQNTTEHIGQIDIVSKLAPHSKLNYGAKYSFRKSSSDADYYNVDASGNRSYMPELSSDYEHRNQIGAAYAESENSWEKWSAKAGLRYEYTWQNVVYHQGKGADFDKHYGNLIPSLAASYNLWPGSNIGFTYNMRISRPGITYLNPYVNQSEPTSRTYGNPDIEVEKNHNLALTLNMYTPKVIISASLRETLADDGIEQYSFFKDNLLHTTYGNIVSRRLSSFNLFASWSATKNTRVVLNGSTTYNWLNSDVLDIKNTGWSANAMLNIQQTLPKSWTVGATLITNTKQKTLQGWRSGFNIGVLTISKSFLKDRLNLSLMGVTGLSKGGKLHIDQHAEGKDFVSTMKISVPVSRIALTARWSFGNTNKQFKQHKSNVQDDYIEHKSSTESMSNAGQM